MQKLSQILWFKITEGKLMNNGEINMGWLKL